MRPLRLPLLFAAVLPLLLAGCHMMEGLSHDIEDGSAYVGEKIADGGEYVADNLRDLGQ